MGLFDKFRKNTADSPKQTEVRESARLLSVEEATSRLYEALAEHTGWKYLKSQRCLKKTVGDLVFEIDFHTSQWNRSFETVYVECSCHMWCKAFDKTSNTHSHVGFYPLYPLDEEGKPLVKQWHDIYDEERLSRAIEQIGKQFDETVLPLYRAFEEDFTAAAIYLAQDENFKKYNVRLRFLDEYAGREYIYTLAKNYVDSLPDIWKEDIEKYKQGDRSKSWMLNPSNLRYIVDNDLLNAPKNSERSEE